MDLLKKFTIGWISHDKEVHSRLLGPSLSALLGEFDTIQTTDSLMPAQNYNTIIRESETPYVCLTHQDATFSPDLLSCLEKTIESLDDSWGALGMVGVTDLGEYKWSKKDSIFQVDTLDCCFLVIKRDSGVFFDEETFNDYHLYVEDYCAQLKSQGKSAFTILTDACESPFNATYSRESGSYLRHHSATVAKRGYCWGKYREYREKLEKKWPGIKTT